MMLVLVRAPGRRISRGGGGSLHVHTPMKTMFTISRGRGRSSSSRCMCADLLCQVSSRSSCGICIRINSSARWRRRRRHLYLRQPLHEAVEQLHEGGALLGVVMQARAYGGGQLGVQGGRQLVLEPHTQRHALV